MNALLLLIVSQPVLNADVKPTKEAQPIKLERVFRKGEKLEYEVKGQLYYETRGLGDNGVRWESFVPHDEETSFRFTTAVTELKPGGVCQMLFEVPKITTVFGDTAEAAAKEHVEKLNLKFDLMMSPINEVLKFQDLTPKKKDKKKTNQEEDPSKDGQLLMAMASNAVQGLGLQYATQIRQLALFIAPIIGGICTNPILPVEPVKVGDTWKHTATHQPQKDKIDGKYIVKRLDYIYTYQGQVESRGKKVERVLITLDLNTDAGAYENQAYGAKPEQTGLKSLPIKFKLTVECDLDPKTLKTLRAEAKSEGTFKVDLTDKLVGTWVEYNVKGRTIMRLLSER